MFEALTNRLSTVFDGLRGRGALTEADVDAALREVRLALIEADVALPVIKDFLVKVREKAIGADVLRSVTPGSRSSRSSTTSSSKRSAKKAQASRSMPCRPSSS